MWIYKNVEDRIFVWHYVWFSQGGHLVLVKVVLESMLVY